MRSMGVPQNVYGVRAGKCQQETPEKWREMFLKRAQYFTVLLVNKLEQNTGELIIREWIISWSPKCWSR